MNSRMAESRLLDTEAEALAQKVAQTTVENPRAESALSRASAIVRSKGLSAPVIERLICSNESTRAKTHWIVEQGFTGKPEAVHESVRTASKSLGVEVVSRAALLANVIDLTESLLGQSELEPTEFSSIAWANGETAVWLSQRHVVDPCDAFNRAVLCDVGLYAMINALPQVYSALAAGRPGFNITEFEKASFGLRHEDVGEILLADFKFPTKVCEFAKAHHAPPLQLDMEGKLVRTGLVAVEQESTEIGLKTKPAEFSQELLDGALLKEQDVQELRSFASGRLGVASGLRDADLPEAA